MSVFLYKTIANERPQGKSNLYFSCHPDDLDPYFGEYAGRILKIQDCAIWYESEPQADYDPEDLRLRLSRMQLFVMPVTTKLLTTPNRAMDVEFPLAQELHIPVLPLMMEHGLDNLFLRRFGDLQYLDPNDTDKTRRSFDEVLQSYLTSTLVSSELTAKVRAAFDAYIFLSYRKKDRKRAQELMRLIHKNPVCRDIAIWYDEFLIPGEDFNQVIEEMLRKSDLFALAVTPNLVNEVNYVMTTEYPEALAQQKPVLPVEMSETDRSELQAHYKALPAVVPGKDGEEFRKALLEKLKMLAITANDEDPGHNFLIGLAYLEGIDVEVDSERALKLILGAAEAGLAEAMAQLAAMYETGKGVARDYRKGIEWRTRHAAKLREAYEAEQTEDLAKSLAFALFRLGDAQYDIRLLDDAERSYKEVYQLAELFAGSQKSEFVRLRNNTFDRLGSIAAAKGNLAVAEEYFGKSLEVDESLVKETGSAASRRDLSISCNRLGDLARSRKDLRTAEKYYKRAFDIRKELAAETGSAAARRDLAVSYGNLGDLAKERDDLPGALEQYKEEAAILESLTDDRPAPDLLLLLSIGYFDLGDILRRMGDLSEAKRYFEKYVAINKSLADETGTVGSRRNLAIGYHRLGLLCETAGDEDGAWQHYKREYRICSKLADETGTLESLMDLAVCYGKLGDVMRQIDCLSDAQEYYEKALALRESVAEKEKIRSVSVKNALSVNYRKLADVLAARRDHPAAQEFYEKRIDILESLAKETGSVKTLEYLAAACFNDGLFCLNTLQDRSKAETMFRKVMGMGKNYELPKVEAIKERAEKQLKKHFS